MVVIKRIAEFMLQTNLWIALAAVAYTLQAQLQLGLPLQWQPYLLLIFCATLFEYNAHRFITVFFKRADFSTPKYAWVQKNLTAFYAIVFISVAGFIAASFVATIEVLLVLLPLGLLTLFYTVPVYRSGKKLMRLREIPLAKIFIISLVWSATSLILPLTKMQGITWPTAQLILLALERCLFIFAITVPFDIRDMEADSYSGLKTLPRMVGEKKAWQIAALAILAFAAMAWYNNAPAIFAGLAVSAAITLFFLINKRVRQLPQYHYGLLDGSILLQSLLVIAAFYLLRQI